MIINPVTYAEQEYQQPFNQIVAEFAADGEPVARVAAILHIELPALQNFAALNGIRFTGHNCPTPEPGINRKLARRNSIQSPRYCYRGQDLTPIEWAERTGLPSKTICRRIQRGWPIEKALTTPTMTKTQIAHLGVQARKAK